MTLSGLPSSIGTFTWLPISAAIEPIVERWFSFRLTADRHRKRTQFFIIRIKNRQLAGKLTPLSIVDCSIELTTDNKDTAAFVWSPIPKQRTQLFALSL
jgi:hypothetical protein